MSVALRVARADEIGSLSIGTTPAPGEVEISEIAVLLEPRRLAGCLGFKRNDPNVAIPDVRFGDHIGCPTQRTGSW